MGDGGGGGITHAEAARAAVAVGGGGEGGGGGGGKQENVSISAEEYANLVQGDRWRNLVLLGGAALLPIKCAFPGVI